MMTRMLCSISSTPQPKTVGNFGDEPHELVALGIAQARRRLVQQDEAGRHGERAADADPPLVAVGQRVRPIVGPVRELHPGEDTGGTAGGFAAPEPHSHCRGLQILDHWHVAEEPNRLEGAGETAPPELVRGQAGHIVAAELDPPPCGR